MSHYDKLPTEIEKYKTKILPDMLLNTIAMSVIIVTPSITTFLLCCTTELFYSNNILHLAQTLPLFYIYHQGLNRAALVKPKSLF